MSEPRHMPTGLEGNLYRPLTDADVKKITDAAFEVLSKSGVAVHSDSGLKAFEDAGADVDHDNRRVRLPRSLVEDAIASTPSSVTLYSRDGANDLVLERNRVYYATGGTAIYVLDPTTGQRRPSTTEDVVLNARMVEALSNIHGFTINVFPNEIKDTDEIDLNRFFHAMDNTTKHVQGGIYSMAGLQKVIRMAQTIAGSAAELKSRPFVSFITLLISPFKIDRIYGEMTCHLAREGLPVVVPTEPICGTTSPITLAGNVLTHVAETLSGIVMVQCVSKGAPAICGSVGSITNLRTMDHLGGPIERAIINAAVSQMMQHFEIPLYSTAGTSDAKNMNVQAAYETAMSSLLVAMSGANYIHDIAGLTESDLTVSYEKLVVDNEILGMCQRVLRGIEVNDDTLAADLMIQKGPGKDFCTEGHTIEYMRQEFYEPMLANRTKGEERIEDQTALAGAQRFVQDMLQSPPESRLPTGLRDDILKEFPEIRLVT